MKGLFFIVTIVIFAGATSASAQSATKYFINNREIAPESVFYFNQNDIDSIRQFVDTDTNVVFYTHRPEKILSYHQLLDLHLINKSARNLQVDLSEATNIKSPEKLVFSVDRVLYVSIIYRRPVNTKSVWIASTYESWDQKSEKGSLLSKLRRRFNNLK
jgi:hypothetical protein